MNRHQPYVELQEAVNIGATKVVFFIDQSAGKPPVRYELAPGETCKIEPGYLKPVDRAGSDPLPSILTRITKGAVVALSSDAGKAFLASKARSAAKAPKAVVPPGEDAGKKAKN